MALAFYSITLLLFFISLSSSPLYIVYALPYSSHHLSFSLTHRDAESSPLRSLEADPADLPHDMPLKSFVASGRALRARLNMQGKQLMMATQPLVQGRLSYGGAISGDFFLTVPVGMPSQNLIFLVDTGSEFSWTQCSPCLNCTRTTAPRFAYTKSSSFRAIPCDSYLCLCSVGFIKVPSACDNTAPRPGPCNFLLGYGDQSTDIGFFSIDTFHLGPNFSNPFVFGCSTSVQKTLPTTSSGLMGLDAGPFSFTSQLFSGSPGMPKKFAYCLPDRIKSLNARGRIKFGNYKQPMQMRFTPFASPYGPLASLYYYVELQGITVGESLIEVNMEQAERIMGGGTVLDSGSPVTYLVKPLYDKLVGEMRRQTEHLQPFNASETELGSDLCYKVAARAREVPEMPKMSMHFAGGVDLELGPGSILIADRIRGDNASIYFCLAFHRTPDLLNSLNIIGNYQQQDYWVEYNLDTSSLGLAKAKCADL